MSSPRGQVKPREPDEMNECPFRMFRCFISGKMDDRLHSADMFLKNMLLYATGTASRLAIQRPQWTTGPMLT